MTHPIVHPEPAELALASRCEVGEGPVWDPRTDTLLFVDVKDPTVWRFRPASGESIRLPVSERVGFVALTADPDVVIAGFKSGLAELDLRNGSRRPVVAPEPDQPQNRLNDGHAGPRGHLYFGSMDDEEEQASGRFYVWDGKELEAFGAPAVVTNGPALSPDGRILYTTDTRSGQITRHALDAAGRPGEANLFIRFEEGWGHPDGMAVDAEGHIWVCHWGASRITRFTPGGEPERVLPVPTAQVTKCCFGGPDLTTLFITTAAIGRDPTLDPMAGHLFRVETGIRGLPAHHVGGGRGTRA